MFHSGILRTASDSMRSMPGITLQRLGITVKQQETMLKQYGIRWKAVENNLRPPEKYITAFKVKVTAPEKWITTNTNKKEIWEEVSTNKKST